MHDMEALSRIKINNLLTVADYLLLDSYNRPIAVVEAKALNINPLSAKTQVKNYAEGMKAPFVYLSNSDKHYFGDIASGNPKDVIKFHTASELIYIRDRISEA